MGRGSGLIQLKSRQRTIGRHQISRRLLDHSHGFLCNRHGEGEKLDLGRPRPVMPGTFFYDLNLRPGTFHEFLRFEADILIPQVTRYLIRHPPRFLREIHGQAALTLYLHEVLADVIRMLGHSFRIVSGHQTQIFPLHHETTTGGGNDDIIALIHP